MRLLTIRTHAQECRPIEHRLREAHARIDIRERSNHCRQAGKADALLCSHVQLLNLQAGRQREMRKQ
jgi:hypothetical protein